MKLIFMSIFLILTNCLPNNPLVPAFDAQSQINAAAEYKAKECKTPVPQPPLYVFFDQQKRNVDLCSIAITRMQCPFYDYPIVCLGIYLKQPVPDFPWYVNFNELTKVRFKP